MHEYSPPSGKVDFVCSGDGRGCHNRGVYLYIWYFILFIFLFRVHLLFRHCVVINTFHWYIETETIMKTILYSAAVMQLLNNNVQQLSFSWALYHVFNVDGEFRGYLYWFDKIHIEMCSHRPAVQVHCLPSTSSKVRFLEYPSVYVSYMCLCLIN